MLQQMSKLSRNFVGVSNVIKVLTKLQYKQKSSAMYQIIKCTLQSQAAESKGASE